MSSNEHQFIVDLALEKQTEKGNMKINITALVSVGAVSWLWKHINFMNTVA